jgi:hypothetical protein
MARKVLVRLVDDLDGLPSEDVATVTFSLDRVDYQIDLNESNASKLREGLADFVAAARRTGGRIKRGAGASARAASNDGPAIREWAREQGHQLAERGRIPSHIVDAFHAASGKGKAKVTRIETAEKPARRTAAKTAAASRTAASTTATTTTRRTRSAAAKPAAKAAAKPAAAKPAAARTTKAAAAKTTEKAAKTTTAKTAKTPRSTASTAASKGGQRAARRAPAKSR